MRPTGGASLPGRGRAGYGNDKTEHCYEVWKAGMAYMVPPRSTLHVAPPPPHGGLLRMIGRSDLRCQRAVSAALSGSPRVAP